MYSIEFNLRQFLQRHPDENFFNNYMFLRFLNISLL